MRTGRDDSVASNPRDRVVGLHVSALVDRGDGASAVASSMRTAHDHGVAATPAWLFGDEFVIPGAEPRELFERIVARLRARAG